jgi:3-oxoadipate enol-lactonase
MKREARSGDVRIAWEELGSGSGDPVLFVHGLGYERHGWGPAPGRLAERYRVLVFDNRGVGESDVPPAPYTVAGMAADALAVLDSAGIERAHVIAASLGGMIAQELVLAAPARVDRLVLCCTTPGGASAYPMPEKTQLAFAAFAADPSERGLRRLVENALAEPTVRNRPELVDEILAYRLAHRPRIEGWQAQAFAGFGFDADGRLAEIRTPTLVLHGTADNVVDVRNARLLADAIPGARLELIPDTGHIFMWEEPERFVRLVTEFLG